MFEFIKEYGRFLKKNKKLWMLPLIFMLLISAVLIFVVGGAASSPFIYTLF